MGVNKLSAFVLHITHIIINIVLLCGTFLMYRHPVPRNTFVCKIVWSHLYLGYIFKILIYAYFWLVKSLFLPLQKWISKSCFNELEDVINIIDINLQVSITYWFYDLTYLFILAKNVYLRLVNISVFYPTK